MTLRQWNSVLQDADGIVNGLNAIGIPSKAVVYTMYDGRRGIRLVAYDAHGNVFSCMNSGIHKDPTSMRNALERCAERIRRECL